MHRRKPVPVGVYTLFKICLFSIIRTCERTILETLKIKKNTLTKKYFFHLVFYFVFRLYRNMFFVLMRQKRPAGLLMLQQLQHQSKTLT